jgi:hypothetical protein
VALDAARGSGEETTVSTRTGVRTCGRWPAQAAPPNSVTTRKRFTEVPVEEDRDDPAAGDLMVRPPPDVR